MFSPKRALSEHKQPPDDRFVVHRTSFAWTQLRTPGLPKSFNNLPKQNCFFLKIKSNRAQREGCTTAFPASYIVHLTVKKWRLINCFLLNHIALHILGINIYGDVYFDKLNKPR